MADFARQISDLILYQELDRSARRDGIDQTEVDRLKGLVNDVAETVGPVMAQIPVTFRQYTVHDIRHCRNVIDRMGDILPEETRSKLNALEITFLLLSALLHDIGMVVSDSEKAEAQRSVSFRRFREEGHSDRSKAIEDARAAGNEPRARAIEDALLAEYYRRLHPERVRQFMENHLSGKLRYQEVDFSDDLARLCESHVWGVEESNDGRHPEKAIARLDDNVRLYGVRVNLQYLACILRLADILDFDRSRTPLAVFQHLDFTEPKSWEEWNKHLQVKGWEITPTQVGFEIPCTKPVFYVAVHEFLGWIDAELRQCRYLVENKPQATVERYKLRTPQVVDRHKVRMADPSYVAGAFRFRLEYENILQLLMDKSLYPDPSLFLRELLQNALDACRRKEAEMELASLKSAYKPRITVWDRTDDPRDPCIIFQDNGIGMSQRIVEHYFLRIGKSYYRSAEFDCERQRIRESGKELDACSQFGIGILSCFLVGDRFEVETFQEGHEPLHILIEGPTQYFVIRRLQDSSAKNRHSSDPDKDGPPTYPGTRITVHLRSGVEVAVGQTLATFATNVDFPITVYRADQKKPKVIKNFGWEKDIGKDEFVFSNAEMIYTYLSEGSVVLELPALAYGLFPSYIPFADWPFSAHIHGRSWFWLLRGVDDQETTKSGFLEVGSALRLSGAAKIIADLDRESKQVKRYRDWRGRLRRLAESSHLDFGWRRTVNNWKNLSEQEREKLDEAILLRDQLSMDIGGRYDAMKFWSEEPRVIEDLLQGSIAWAGEPWRLNHKYGIGVDVANNSKQERISLHSILLPAGIVEWSPIEVKARRIRMLPMFGGLRIDVRGPRAPRPAAHRLFSLRSEAVDLRHQYLRAAVLHGVSLVAKHPTGEDWRRWFCELVSNLGIMEVDTAALAKCHGECIGEICKLAISLGGKEVLLTPSEVAQAFPGGAPVVDRYSDEEQPADGWLSRDPVNSFLSDRSTWPSGKNVHVEVDISSLPFRYRRTRVRRTRRTRG